MTAAILAAAAIAAPTAGAATQTVRISPNEPTIGNCYPFGLGDPSPSTGGWGPYAAFVYKNIPAFLLQRNDTLAFDLGKTNDADAQLQIDLAGTTTNGGVVQAGSFTKVVSNSQTPANPRGDTTVGDFEMRFRIEAPFSFPGGGLIIRFSNPSAAYATDLSCDGNLVRASSSDSSGFFVQRAFNDDDGVAPWSAGTTPDTSIGAFQISAASLFTIGKPRLHKKKGTATEPVTVPGPGTLSLTGKGVATQSSSSARASVAVGGPGTVNLRVKPKGKKRQQLNRTGKAKVKLSITYAPTFGKPDTETTKIKLKKG